MSATPSDWISNSLLAVEAVLADSAGVRTMIAAADAAASKAKTHWQVTRSGLTGPYILLTAHPGTVATPDALRVPQHLDQVDAYIAFTPATVGGDTDKDKAIRACNALGLALSEIVELIGTGTTYPVRASITAEPPQPCPDDGPDAGLWDCLITFTWEI